MSAIELIKTEIRQRAAEHGLYVHRYQTNSQHIYQTVVTYALHSQPEKPRFSRQCDRIVCRLNRIEGKTEKCHAYRQLTQLLGSI